MLEQAAKGKAEEHRASGEATPLGEKQAHLRLQTKADCKLFGSTQMEETRRYKRSTPRKDLRFY